jgi:TIR domain
MANAKHPCAFLSYSHDGPEQRRWVLELATRLRRDGVETILDQWELEPGDHLPEFMEKAVRENDFVLIICTPSYKERSEQRIGGVGYEGDIMTAEVLTARNLRKFKPVLRSGEWNEATPTWLMGRVYADLRGDPYSEEHYRELLQSLLGIRPKRPPVGPVVAPFDYIAPRPRKITESEVGMPPRLRNAKPPSPHYGLPGPRGEDFFPGGELPQEAQPPGSVQSVSGHRNIVAGRDINYVNKREVIRPSVTPGPEHITEDQAKRLKDLVEKAAQIEINGGSPPNRAFSKWWSELKNRYGVTSYHLIPRLQGDAAIKWLQQRNAMLRPKLRRANPGAWRVEHFNAIWAKSNELGMSKGEVYSLIGRRLNVQVGSLKNLGDRNLKRAYNIMMSLDGKPDL